jgi:hypothetical protein
MHHRPPAGCLLGAAVVMSLAVRPSHGTLQEHALLQHTCYGSSSLLLLLLLLLLCRARADDQDG